MRALQLYLKAPKYILFFHTANWIVRRPEWLREYDYSNYIELWEGSYEYCDAERESMRSVCSEIVDYFSGEMREDEYVDVRSIWGDYRHSLYKNLFDTIGSKADFSAFMSRLFRDSAVNGFSYGTTFDRLPHAWKYVPLHIELSIVQLAESVGIIRSECADQGKKAFWRSEFSETELIEKLESHFGFRIESPRFGDPRGIWFGNRFITREVCSQIYSANRIYEKAILDTRKGNLKVLEIGGGYGGLSYWLQKLGGAKIKKYDMIDLVEAGIIQYYFSSLSMPEKIISFSDRLDADMSIIRHTELGQIGTDYDIVINQDSLPEMGYAEAERYVEWISKLNGSIFVSLNQEAYSGNQSTGELQASVPQITKKFASLERVARERSWDRRGYVEEVYKVTAP
jgi:hypothetical protein